MISRIKYTGAKLTALVLFIFIASCVDEVIDIDLSEYRDTIVIEGSISDSWGPHRVRLSKSNYIFDSSNNQTVNDAAVTIEDDEGNLAVLNEISPGLYQTGAIRGIPGRTYTLRVLADGEEYTATSKMPQPLGTQNMEVEFQRINFNEYFLVCSFIDKEGVDEYYRINFYRNGYYLDYDMVLYHGTHSDGQSIDIDNLHTLFYRMDRYEVEFISLNRTIYEFYTFLENAENNGEGESTDIIEFGYANPPTNLTNGALGYFSAQSYTNYSGIVR